MVFATPNYRSLASGLYGGGTVAANLAGWKASNPSPAFLLDRAIVKIMRDDNLTPPLRYQGVMVSSTFTDLKEHRAALIKAIKGAGLTDVAMENDAAKPVDVIDSSLQMVRDCSAYIAVISHKYGQTPKSTERNPGTVSITELEFDEALRLNRPILLFIMGEEHPVLKADVETNATKRKKLKAFMERAKEMGPDSLVHRVYATFDSVEDFKEMAFPAVASLRRYLDDQTEAHAPRSHAREKTKPDPIPRAPAFYAEPAYIGSHEFLGRKAELETLSDWAAPADPHPILLFEAIGGAGKSLLTWEWTTKHATTVRMDWAGRFWYSFYERGAIMADFCRRALAYITEQPLEGSRKKKTVELGEMLLHQLQARPWLLILDGLERVLVAYHRFDAAQLADEEAGTTDEIAHRDPCAAIRPEDDDLLRALAAAAPSKLLLTSRLMPRVLLNPSNQGIQGVLRVPLPGLRPADAEELLRACGITGNSPVIQSYLKSHTDCHPLVTGVLAGLINDYFPDRGNFDAWAADPNYGGQLNLAKLDLVQKRNHILHTALAALPEKSRELLSTIALLSEAVDYPTLSALNPHLPPEPEKVEQPENLEGGSIWLMSDDNKKNAQQDYQAALQRRKEYEQALKARLQSPEYLTAQQELAQTVRDLERRGLLQYDAQARRYDLHPVVRGITAGGLPQDERDHYGKLVVDHFSRQAHNPYENAETLEDIRNDLHIVRTLLQMGRFESAFDMYFPDLGQALHFNLEANAEILSLLRPFFLQGWATLPADLAEINSAHLANSAAIALEGIGEPKEALAAYGAAIVVALRRAGLFNVGIIMPNISRALRTQNRLAKEERCLLLNLSLASLADDTAMIFRARQYRFRQLARIGRWAEAEAIWLMLDPMGRDWSRLYYRPGDAEGEYAQFRFWKGDLMEEHLAHAKQLAESGRNHQIVRKLHGLSGEWQLAQYKWALAADSLQESVRMTREIGQTDTLPETQLALAKFHLKQLPNPRHEAEQLASGKEPAHRALAELWFAIGDHEQSKRHALASYQWAWADGEPYVHRYELNKTTALLEQLGVEIPTLPPYDPAKDEKLPWENEVEAAIEEQRIEKEAKNESETDGEE